MLITSPPLRRREYPNYSLLTMTITNLGFGKKKSTPSSNTGSSLLFSSRIDWVQGVLKLTSPQLDTLIGEISNIFKDTFAADGGYLFSGRSFQHHRVSDRGCRIGWNILICDRDDNSDDSLRHHLGDRNIDCWIMIPAKLLNGCETTFSLRRFLTMLDNWSFKPTRIDLAIDDYTKSLTWQNFDDARRAGKAYGFKKSRIVSSFGDALGDGFTYYMGSTGSDKLFRFYDKNVESLGETDAYRLEGQFRDDWCKSVWRCLLTSDTDRKFHETIVNCVCTPIDFYDDSTGEKISLDWWSNFKQSVKAKGINLVCGRVVTSLEKSMEWVEKQVETTLAMIEDFCDRSTTDFADWFNKRIESGRSRLRSVHKNRVDSASKVLSELSDGVKFYYEKFGDYPLGMEF